ncbi:MAG: F420-non-reducing hydrogenase large subunit [Methanofollis sp.]|nr:F420-non-reducing hydrogenase large subunit [Methanofollis sp.]
MTRLTIAPVTRIEGHAQVRIDLDEKGEVAGAHFNVVELRGFEKFLIGGAIEEAPRITPRICGICPTSHHVAAARATDRIFGAEPPQTGKMLRELLMTGQYIHSHALHFFMLAAPDFLLGDAAPAERNVIGLAKRSPAIAKNAIEVRKLGQRITEAVGGKPIHPTNAVPGGMSRPLTTGQQQTLLASAKAGLTIAEEGWEIAKGLMDGFDFSLGAVETAFMGMTENGTHAISGGEVRIVGKNGEPLGSFTGEDYLNYIREYTEDWSYLKFCRLASGDHYRVGPLARLNIVERMGTPKANAALAEYRSAFGRFSQTALAYNAARYVEFLSACERAVELLENPGITGTDVRTPTGGVVQRRGVGIIEAPRGTLIHDYSVDENGIIERCNLIVATCQNNYAMDRGVEDVARKVIKNGEVTEEAANKIETVIRAYDPCISCATHAIGRMPLRIEVRRDDGRGGKVIRTQEVN